MKDDKTQDIFKMTSRGNISLRHFLIARIEAGNAAYFKEGNRVFHCVDPTN